MLHDNPDRPVFLIVDGHASHRSKKTKDWVEATGGRLTLFQLPAYSPQLNPDEWVWRNVKGHRVGRAGITSLADLTAKVTEALERLVALPQIVRGFFGDPDLRYITA